MIISDLKSSARLHKALVVGKDAAREKTLSSPYACAGGGSMISREVLE